MKKSKRLLSILLMLTMLVSMFTVMAFAEDPTFCPHKNKVHNEAFPATCTAGGMKEHYYCQDCRSYLEADGLTVTTYELLQTSKLGHDYVEMNDAVKATCTQPGKTASRECSRCDDIIPGTTIPASGHKLDKKNGKEATCTEAGYKAYWQCSVCSGKFADADGMTPITEPEKIPATGHNYVPQDDAVPATCTQPGKTASQKCSKCGDTIEGMSTQMAPHKPVNVPETPATCTEPGIAAGSECAVCHKVISGREVIPAKGHDKELVKHAAVAATCVATGNKEYYECKSCGQLFSDKGGETETTLEAVTTEINPSNHAEKLTKVASKAPTCTEDGYKTYWTCKACKAMYSDSHGKNPIQNPVVIEKLGHDLRNTKKKDADGKEIWKCSRCDYEEHIAPGEKTYTLKVRITNPTKGTIEVNGSSVNSGDTFELKANDKVKFTATPKDNFKAVWTYGDDETTGNTFTVRMSKADATLYVKFVDDDYSDGDYKLTVDISGSSNGTVKLDGVKVYDGDKFWLDKNEEITFRAYPDDGYKVVWTYKGETETGSPYTLKMGSKDAKLYISFVKKSTVIDNDYPTLTFDITGGKHGTVYRGTREYEDGDVISIKKNDKMTFKAKADKGYVAVWTYKGESYVGDEFTVKMGANDAKLYVEFMDKDDIRLTELPFRDVSKRDWYYDDVVYVYRKGYMDGMSSTRFGGELNTTRGQIVTILWRLTGEPRATKRNPFTDVSSSQYYYDAISWAYDAGVVDGFDAYTFKPDQNVTREQLAAILYRYAKYMNLSTSGSAYLAKYKDADKIANWAYDAMAWANYRGLINGTSATRIDPKGYATRAQIAAILHRFAVEYGA